MYKLGLNKHNDIGKFCHFSSFCFPVHKSTQATMEWYFGSDKRIKVKESTEFFFVYAGLTVVV